MTRTDITTADLMRNQPVYGWVFYDGECPLCANATWRFAPLLGRHGFQLAPLQAPWVQARIGLKPGEPLVEMKLLAADGRVFGGAEALLQIARRIWWAWPVFALAQFPGITSLMEWIYRRVAANRQCLGGVCRVQRTSVLREVALLILLPSIALVFESKMPAWVFMWAIAFSLYAGCKWLTFSKWRANGGESTRTRVFGYLLAWPGMDAAGFLSKRTAPVRPGKTEWLFSGAKIAFGTVVVWRLTRIVAPVNGLLAGWMGMIGVIFILHFGLFHLLSLAWRVAGVNATPIMRNPVAATSLTEFWGERWNTAFHELVHRFTFRPFAKRAGVVHAILLVFLLSGLVHELCISLPARGDYGLPTGYFLIQGLGVVAERTLIGRILGLGYGICGWLFTLAVVGAPVFWLFHPLFVHNVILPMLHAIGAI